MKSDLQLKKQGESRRRKREKILLLALILTLVILFYIELNFPALPADLPLSSNIIVFALININFILLLLLIFLIVRNTLKLLLERKRKIVGFRLRSKLAVAFVSLSLFPTLLLFATATGFIRYSIDSWFSAQFETALDSSLEIAQDYYKTLSEQNLQLAKAIAAEITSKGLFIGENPKPMLDYIASKRTEYNLTAIAVYAGKNHLPRATTCADGFSPALLHLATSANDTLYKPLSRVVPLDNGSGLIQGTAPVFSVWNEKEILAVVVATRAVSPRMSHNFDAVSQKFSTYQQTKSMERYIKYSYVLSFLLITALIIFISIWFGFYLAKNITEPLQELALATRKIAGGELDFSIEIAASDEIGILVQSFNEMTERLKASKLEGERANLELVKTNAQLEQRRKYIEIILKNVNAGIISLDRSGKVITINETAARFFGLQAEDCLDKNYRDIFTSEIINRIRMLLKNQEQLDDHLESRELELTLPENNLHLAIRFTRLDNEQQQYVGMLVILHDLTEMVNAQKAIAWREVARRIAHEIKNPLTPIALSAQRIQRKYGSLVETGDQILHNCTSIIIKQVEVMKQLVNEFSNFARMPQAKPSMQDLHTVIKESLMLYQDAHQDCHFIFLPEARLTSFLFDPEQLKRALTNLFDNGLAAIKHVGTGTITIRTKLDKNLQIVIIEICDTGLGISEKDKSRLFEPYFSTKKTGTGLGLAIVKSIIQDHRGFIRVKDNHPRGTCFIIELPFNTRTP
ncbi:MAG: HAMP domain-containing protein [Deltaproteobacteria bacterium]|nr:HAMP domain-containing protein [Candidatus Anaeroferrophillus wilburensis]MBN2888725.1 HAMP domain-containing protein [Deltaproteobacteria bacterium]